MEGKGYSCCPRQRDIWNFCFHCRKTRDSQRIRAMYERERINGMHTKNKVLPWKRQRRRIGVGSCVSVKQSRLVRITTFSKHNNKLHRAGNDSRRDKTKFDSAPRRTAHDPLNRNLCPILRMLADPNVAMCCCDAAMCVHAELRRSWLAHRGTSTTGLFIRESNYASSSPSFIVAKPPAAATFHILT